MTKSKSSTLALVVRVSRVGKREGERFQSPGDQVAIGTARAEREGYDVKVFEKDAENGGVSGATPYDKRPGMSAALAAVESGKLAGVVVAALDRLVREDPEKGVTLKSFHKRIREAGAVLLVADSASAEIIDPDDDELEGVEEWGVEAQNVHNKLTRRESRKRWRRARKNAIVRGAYVGPTPAGYARTQYAKDEGPKVPSDVHEGVEQSAERRALTTEERWADPVEGQLVPGEHADAIRQAFELRAGGASWNKIAAHLTSTGVETKNGNRLWSLKAASKLVENTAYLGRARSGAFENPAAHEPLVEPMLFKRANDRKATRAVVRGDRVPSLLAGFMTCETCKHRLTRDFVVRSGKTHTYYRCRNAGACVARAGVGGKTAEEFVVTRALEHAGTVTGEKALGDDEAFAAAQVELQAAQAAKAQVEEMIGTALPADSKQALAVLDAEKALDAARSGGDILKWYIPGPADRDHTDEYNTRVVFDRMSIEDKRAALQTLIAGMVVTPGKGEITERISIEWKTGKVEDRVTIERA